MGIQVIRRLRVRSGLTVSFGLALFSATASASITGVCPDGSIFIVQTPRSIPCRDAKQVDPSDVPPLKPQLLPRPHGWEVFNRRNDPNNPYNLVHSQPIGTPERAQPAPAPPEAPVPPERVSEREAFPVDGPPAVSAAPPPRSRRGTAPIPFQPAEIRDLAQIVDLSQQRAPAALLARGSGGRVQLARSRAFERRARELLAAEGVAAEGDVVLFSADTRDGGSFHGNLTFVQGHLAFQPDSGDPAQFGLIHGEMGELDPNDPVLGYVVLPAYMDLGQPLDIYWDDRQITATLVP